MVWWLCLCACSALNLVAWFAAARLLHRRIGLLPAQARVLRRWQLLLSAGYVLGCAYRSVCPVFDVPRLCLFDTGLASVAVGRTVATIAELCFVAQWALMLHEVAQAVGSRAATRIAAWLVPMIAVAETFSWYSVLTTSNIGHVVEESLWAAAAALVLWSMRHIWPRCSGRQRWLLGLWSLAGVAYVAYMVGVDVPMYWQRWVADEANGRAYLGLAQGLADVSGRWVVSHRWADWQGEVIWMSLYFSVAVWLSIGLVHAPARWIAPPSTTPGHRAQPRLAA